MERRELEIWIESHPKELKSHTLDEIAELAKAVGFDRRVVDEWLVHTKFRQAV